MHFPYPGPAKRQPLLILTLIAGSTAVSLLLNWYGLTLGITNVLPHLFYIPVVLAAFYFPERGVLFTIALSAAYGTLVTIAGSSTPDSLVSAFARVVVFIVIAAVVGYLSARSQHHAALYRRFASMVESSNDAVVGKTLEGIITDWNSGAERLYGYTRREVIGKPISLLMPLNRADDMPHLIEKIRNGERIGRYETDRITKEGRRIQVSLSLSPIKNAEEPSSAFQQLRMTLPKESCYRTRYCRRRTNGNGLLMLFPT